MYECVPGAKIQVEPMIERGHGHCHTWFISERELMFTFAMLSSVRLSSVCRL